jgi:hypothetical protein
MVKFKGKHTEKKVPRWLNTIQENSWEAELLLSAVLLFGLIQTPIFLESWSQQLFAWETGIIKGVVEMIIRGIEILRIGFIIHIIVRALWIAQVGFSYVFPKGIQVEKLGFQGNFRTELNKNNSTVNSIMRLEKIASTVFAISFSLFGLAIGLIGFLSPVFLIGFLTAGQELSTTTENIILSFLFIYSGLSILVFIDFVTNGVLRRGKKRAMVYYPIALFYRFFTLSFLYRKTLLTIISNVAGYRRYLITIGMIIIIQFIDDPSSAMLEYQAEIYAENTKNGFLQKENYETKRDDEDILVVTIPSDIIENNFLPIFVQNIDLLQQRSIIDKESEKDNSKRVISFNVDKKNDGLASKAANLSQLLKISIDDDAIDSVLWNLTIHPTTYTKGFMAYLDISKLSQASHRINVKVQRSNLLDSIKRDSLIANILFYKSN